MKPERLAREIIYESPWVNLYLDKVKFPNGVMIEKFHLLDFPRAAVMAIVENEAGEILFVQICRYTNGATEWELPAGGIEAGESINEAATREVMEETGYTTEASKLIYSYYPMNGSANKLFHIVHCKAIECVQDFDRNEVSATRWFAREEVEKMVWEKTLSDGFALTAVLLWLGSFAI